MGSSRMTAACVVLTFMVVSTALVAEAAVTCNQVVTDLSPCVGYLLNGGPVPPACCGGVKSLFSAATTTNDRQTACKCMKTAAASVSNANLAYASSLPAKCGVNIPYKISPSTDCSKIQ